MADLLPLVGKAPYLADLIEQALFVNLFLLEILAFFVALFLDDLAHADLVLGQFLAQIQHVGERERARQYFVDDPLFAVFDLLGDFDFAFAAEERDRAHLAQIHAHRIAGLADEIPVHVAVDFLLFLFLLGKIFARAAEDRHHVVDLVRRDHFRRQHVVHVVVSEIALLLAQIDELLHLFQILLLHRAGGRIRFGGRSFGYRTGCFGSGFRRSSWRSFRTRSCHSSILSLFAFSSFCSSAARILTRRSRSMPLKCRRRRCERQSVTMRAHSASDNSSAPRARAATSPPSPPGSSWV